MTTLDDKGSHDGAAPRYNTRIPGFPKSSRNTCRPVFRIGLLLLISRFWLWIPARTQSKGILTSQAMARMFHPPGWPAQVSREIRIVVALNPCCCFAVVSVTSFLMKCADRWAASRQRCREKMLQGPWTQVRVDNNTT
jgi:hypothetical protein